MGEWACGPPKVMKTPVAHALVRAAFTLVCLDSVENGVRRSANTARKSACATSAFTEPYPERRTSAKKAPTPFRSRFGYTLSIRPKGPGVVGFYYC